MDSGSEPSDTDADTDSEDSGGGDTGTPTQGDTRTLSGTIQWTVDFDAEAEALGFKIAPTRESTQGLKTRANHGCVRNVQSYIA